MWSRRALIKSLAGSTMAAGMVGFSGGMSAAWAEDELLPFRKNATLLRLHFNENSAGMSPKAVAAAQQALGLAHNRYPDQALQELRQAIATREGVSEASVVLGGGSTEVLYMTVAACAEMEATIIDTVPTFGEVRSFGARLGMNVVQVPVRDDFTTDLEAMKSAATAVNGPVLINLCNPNNPTGTIIPETDLTAWIMEAPDSHIFLIDEAYFDYAAAETKGYGSMLPLVKAGREKLIISRTFSKVHGMAGLRVGYGIATEETAKLIGAYTNMVNLNVVGAVAAAASLNDTAFYQKSLKENQKAKAILLNALSELGLEHVPSSTNFVLHRINSDVVEYQRRMMANGIRVGRRMTKEDGWNRISLGTPQEMMQFTETLRAFRTKGWA